MRVAQEKPMLLNSYLTQDDAGSFILKKLGMYKEPIQGKDLKYAKGGMSFNFTMEYYN
jgi:hypothetical protein